MTTIHPSTPKFFHADDGTKTGAFLSGEREHDTGDIIIHAPAPMRITASKLDAYIAWLAGLKGPKG